MLLLAMLNSNKVYSTRILEFVLQNIYNFFKFLSYNSQRLGRIMDFFLPFFSPFQGGGVSLLFVLSDITGVHFWACSLFSRKLKFRYNPLGKKK